MSLGQAEEMLDARRLHTHFGQDGGIFNGDTPKFCALAIWLAPPSAVAPTDQAGDSQTPSCPSTT